jgi:hypothetical protein
VSEIAESRGWPTAPGGRLAENRVQVKMPQSLSDSPSRAKWQVKIKKFFGPTFAL